MNTLNKEIRTMEMMLLDRKIIEAEKKKELDKMILLIKNSLDPKDKEFSNDEKRQLFALSNDEVQQKIVELKNHEYETSIMEIEIRYKLRELEILRVYMLKGVDDLCQ